jgi:hypothetical protein
MILSSLVIYHRNKRSELLRAFSRNRTHHGRSDIHIIPEELSQVVKYTLTTAPIEFVCGYDFYTQAIQTLLNESELGDTWD